MLERDWPQSGKRIRPQMTCVLIAVDRGSESGLLSEAFVELFRMKKTLLALALSGSRGLLIAALAMLCLAPLYAGEPKQHKHDGRHQIDQLEEAWRLAVLKSDINSMASLLADDFMGITPNGTMQTRDQILDNLRSGRTHLTALDVSDQKVRFYGKTAVVTSFAHMEGTTLDGEMDGNFRYTRVYVKNPAGEWKIVSFEASRIRKPGQRH